MMEVESSKLSQRLAINTDVDSVSDYLSLFQTFFDTSLDNIAVYGTAGQLVYANAALRNTLHLKKETGPDYVDIKS